MTTTRRVRRMVRVFVGVRGEKRVRGGEISPRRAALGRLLKEDSIRSWKRSNW
ncbi:hypothetical protein E1A91_D09G200500v1 [Gossypium mustelinum]|uniref:Uncharacterized protein n=1 Tax=Gossypium mustelinum TaxID=34275 RepID=A0A5D2TP67_GOSMU|nr:hypothetical protein E1A91_D09G200500v1 [Gossypium mustelinum]